MPWELPKALSVALAELSRREGATLFMTLLAGFQTLLHRYTGGDDDLGRLAHSRAQPDGD